MQVRPSRHRSVHQDSPFRDAQPFEVLPRPQRSGLFPGFSRTSCPPAVHHPKMARLQGIDPRDGFEAPPEPFGSWDFTTSLGFSFSFKQMEPSAFQTPAQRDPKVPTDVNHLHPSMVLPNGGDVWVLLPANQTLRLDGHLGFRRLNAPKSDGSGRNTPRTALEGLRAGKPVGGRDPPIRLEPLPKKGCGGRTRWKRNDGWKAQERGRASCKVDERRLPPQPHK